MFKSLGNFVTKFRVWIILVWLAAAIVMYLFAPSLSEVGQMDNTAFLPSDSESSRAGELINQYFPGTGASASDASLIFFDQQGLSDADLEYASQVRDWLKTKPNNLPVGNITSIFDNPGLKTSLISPDKTTMIMNVGTSGEMDAGEAVKIIREHLTAAPEFVKVYVTGQLGVSADMKDAVMEGLDRTTLITIILVVVLLLLIYRSPIAVLVPLLTIGIAYLISRGALGYIAQAGVSVWSQMDSFLIVLVFGVGTDYCLFLVSRYREELKRQDSRVSAMRHTVSKIGVVITASAFTVIIGLSGMAIGKFEMIKTMGPLMALTVFITLLAAVTLAPAFASVMGKYLFWPLHSQVERVKKSVGTSKPSFFERIAGLATSKPVPVIIAVVVLLALPCIAIPWSNSSFDTVKELPSNTESSDGYNILQTHYDIGAIEPSGLIIAAPQGQNVSSPDSLAAISKISQDLKQVGGVIKVQSITDPQGSGQTLDALTVSGQLNNISSSLNIPGSDASALFNEQTTAGFRMMGAYLNELSANFTWVKDDADYQKAAAGIVQLSAAIAQMKTSALVSNDSTAMQNLVSSLKEQLAALSAKFKAKGNPVFLSNTLVSASTDLQVMKNTFISSNQQATRLYIVLDSYPASDKAIQSIKDIRSIVGESIQKTSLNGSQALTAGNSAMTADIKQILDVDFNRIMILVMITTFIVLLLVVRSLVAAVYMMLAVVLSYEATIGLVTLIFQNLLGQDGISFMIPIVIFVLLVALGSDYNIFLMTRVREESEKRPTRDGARIAAAATGLVIMACGLILAGTFGSLASSPIRTMIQLGAAVAIGVIIDTCIIQTLLLPALATKLGKWNWWPVKRG
jgi:RND superfamily putative drug exporter